MIGANGGGQAERRLAGAAFLAAFFAGAFFGASAEAAAAFAGAFFAAFLAGFSASSWAAALGAAFLADFPADLAALIGVGATGSCSSRSAGALPPSRAALARSTEARRAAMRSMAPDGAS